MDHIQFQWNTVYLKFGSVTRHGCVFLRWVLHGMSLDPRVHIYTSDFGILTLSLPAQNKGWILRQMLFCFKPEYNFQPRSQVLSLLGHMAPRFWVESNYIDVHVRLL